jgi:hypothetical protein
MFAPARHAGSLLRNGRADGAAATMLELDGSPLSFCYRDCP